MSLEIGLQRREKSRPCFGAHLAIDWICAITVVQYRFIQVAESANMHSKRIAVGVCWLVCAAKLMPTAMAQEDGQVAGARLHEVEGPQQPRFLSASDVAVTNIPYDDGFHQQWDEEVSVTDLPSATAEDQQSESPTCAAT